MRESSTPEHTADVRSQWVAECLCRLPRLQGPTRPSSLVGLDINGLQLVSLSGFSINSNQQREVLFLLRFPVSFLGWLQH